MALYCGAAIGFFRGNVLLIKDDLAALQPTIFPSVPRLFNKFHGRIQDAFDAAQVRLAGLYRCTAKHLIAQRRRPRCPRLHLMRVVRRAASPGSFAKQSPPKWQVCPRASTCRIAYSVSCCV
jgi:long-subunit acyl-CoA synthetase (AMP-forming)